ncbi:4-hydroxy-tetrahydrodipicolinate reductase [Sandaracinomonas limnophila]|uniref:4-hydroxy-tetrahydrodipicolinate reductase n=1 Tax=Sandaracinomonas limnophila TaxID=1862386 RepID=A0A437PX43_9BACT|nr:4-hydroxy-tetrahydrodipicolinate reductase [Sandaracinomonas limnophila]RVU26837.1 4-hydroxy-tetrahydrodipicolinate reductase [Sandaracinomonas limnophila]
MRIVLIGYGKMGKEIEKIAVERGHSIVAKIDVDNQDDLDQLSIQDVDVAIEFSNPISAFGNLVKCIEKNIPVVCGTTGWLEKRAEIEDLTKVNNSTFFYASNYSIGVNLFFKLNKFLAGLMKNHSEYDIYTNEIHHLEKKDSPSGTAITVAEGIIDAYPTKTKWVNNEIPEENEVAIWSQRESIIPGTHTVKYISKVDQIEITHEAFSRKGFALGAVIAAEWVKDKKGILGMENLLEL